MISTSKTFNMIKKKHIYNECMDEEDGDWGHIHHWE
jgi:hypothetical protein